MSHQSLLTNFKTAMQQLAASVTVVSTTDSRGVPSGLTATAVCSLSFEPASMLVCINEEAQSLPVIQQSGLFCINLLRYGQQDVSDVFAGRTQVSGEERFAEAGQWTLSHLGPPMLDTALANVVCELSESKAVGTHHICIGYVRDVRLDRSGKPLVYAHQQYNTVQ